MRIFQNLKHNFFFALAIISYMPAIFCAYLPDNLRCHGLYGPVIVCGISEKHGSKPYCLEVSPGETAEIIVKEIGRQLNINSDIITKNGNQPTAESIIYAIKETEKLREQAKKIGLRERILFSLID